MISLGGDPLRHMEINVLFCREEEVGRVKLLCHLSSEGNEGKPVHSHLASLRGGEIEEKERISLLEGTEAAEIYSEARRQEGCWAVLLKSCRHQGKCRADMKKRSIEVLSSSHGGAQSKRRGG